MEQVALKSGIPAEEEEVSVEETAEPEVSTEESAQQTEEGVVTETQETAPAPQPRKQTAQERIDEITFARREAERQAEYWRNIALQAQAQKPAETQPPAAASDRPSLENFQTTEAYEDALLDWKLNQQAAKQAQAQVKVEQDKAVKDFHEKAQNLKMEYPDFEEVIRTPVFTPVMEHAIYSVSDNGALLAYHLALPENRIAVNALAKLPPDKQLVELGKFESNMLLNKATKKNTNAPTPIKPVGASAGGETSVEESKMQDNDWFAYKDKQRRDAFQKRQ